MDAPDGWRAEITGGGIVMSPWPEGYCLPVLRSLRKQLEPHAPEGHLVDCAPFPFAFPAEERGHEPDVYGACARAFDGHGHFVDGEALSFVAEVTSSSTLVMDRGDKPATYGKSGVPVHLLLDMQSGTATVFWDPSPQGYTSHRTVPFGETLPVPSPFDVQLDTTVFAAAVQDRQRAPSRRAEQGPLIRQLLPCGQQSCEFSSR